jgi:hypothetical protein
MKANWMNEKQLEDLLTQIGPHIEAWFNQQPKATLEMVESLKGIQIEELLIYLLGITTDEHFIVVERIINSILLKAEENYPTEFLKRYSEFLSKFLTNFYFTSQYTDILKIIKDKKILSENQHLLLVLPQFMWLFEIYLRHINLLIYFSVLANEIEFKSKGKKIMNFKKIEKKTASEKFDKLKTIFSKKKSRHKILLQDIRDHRNDIAHMLMTIDKQKICWKNGVEINLNKIREDGKRLGNGIMFLAISFVFYKLPIRNHIIDPNARARSKNILEELKEDYSKSS